MNQSNIRYWHFRSSKKPIIRLRRLSFLIGLLLFSHLAFLSQSAYSSGLSHKSKVESPRYVEGEVLVKFKMGASEDVIRGLHGQAGQETGVIAKLNLRRVKVKSGISIEDAIAKYSNNPVVEYVEPNYILHADLFPNDSSFPQLWGLHNTGQMVDGMSGTPDADIDATEAWDVITGNQNIVIAVTDSGVAYDHPDLAANIWVNPGEIPGNGMDDDNNGYIDDTIGWDFIHNDNDPMDYNGHGTHVAGTIGAAGNNGIGITGVLWDIRIMSLRFLDGTGSGTTFDAVNAILYAAGNGALIINASWGGSLYSQALSNAISYAEGLGVLFVAAAGNESSDNDNPVTPSYPANFSLTHSNVISVAATDQTDNLSFFSNYGLFSVDVAAPGENIYSTVPARIVVWDDNFDTGVMTGWTTGGVNNTWNVTQNKSSSPQYSLTDSPSGNYLPNTDSWAYTPVINLTGEEGCVLSFNMDIDTPFPPEDYLYVEGSTDSVSWANISRIGGTTQGYFVPFDEDITAYDNQPATYIRFRLESDAANNNDGVYIDDVTIKCRDFVYHGNEYEYLMGTSMAAPHVSGLAGLILAFNPAINYLTVKNAILNGVDTLPSLTGLVSSDGRINAFKSLQLMGASDTTPPAAIGDLATGAVTDASVQLTWTSPGDDGNTGTATTYEVCYDTAVPVCALNCNCVQLPALQPAGNQESFTVTGLTCNTTYYFDVSAADEVPNWSNFSNTAFATTVACQNLPPVADSQPVTTSEETPVAITLTGSDPDNDPLTFSVVSGPASGALGGIAPNLIYSPYSDFNGLDSFTFKVNDGLLDSNIATISITVTPVNDPPMLNPINPKAVNEGSLLSFSVSGSDPDGDAITFSAVDLPPGATFDPATKTFSWTPDFTQSGLYSVTFTVSDGSLTDSEVVVITVNDIAQPQAPVEIPRTGQMTCYNTNGAVIPCSWTGQDGAIRAGTPWPDPRFTDNNDETVTDNLTGLMWTKNANLPGAPTTWQQALDYVAGMNQGTYPNLGYTDWRLPNINELDSLVDAERTLIVLPEGNPFINVQYGSYWSSTTDAWNSYRAWRVHMYGAEQIYSKTSYGESIYMWPVRSAQSGVIQLPRTGQTICYGVSGSVTPCAGTGQDGDTMAGVSWPDPRFTDNDDGTVKDNLTNLTWTKDANLPLGVVTWQQSLDYIAGMNAGINPNFGYTDWRLPNWKELQSLVDRNQYNPALPSGHPFVIGGFVWSAPGIVFWSSTTYMGDSYTSSSWYLRISAGLLNGGTDKSWNFFVWPVRGGYVGQDPDNDGIPDITDNCPSDYNPNQNNNDLDSLGDVCDPDDDNDGISDTTEIATGSDPLNPASTPEVCDGIDNDLDGQTDEGVQNTYYQDADSDLYGNVLTTTLACTAPSGYVSNNTDCNDGNTLINPAASEVCSNSADDNCNGQVDEGCTVSPYFIEVNTAYTFGQVESLASYQGNLFAGTRPSSLWKSGDGIIFSDIANPTLYISNPRSLAEFNNELYLLGYGSSPYSAAAIWKSSDGINFTNIISNGFGDANNIDIPSSAVFNGKLFVGTLNDGTTGGEVWNSTDGITWSQTGADGLGNPNNSRIGELVEFNGYLYAGTRNDVDGASVYRKFPGQPWEMVVGGNGNAYAGANSASGFGSGTGNPLNERIFASAVFNGNLYMGVKHSETSTSPSEIWRTSDGINWYQINGNGFGDPNNYGIDSMQVYNNKLYAGTINPNAGAELWVSDDGMNWTIISDNGFGNTTVNQVIRSMTVFNGALYIGTGNREFAPLSGGEIWKYESANTPQGTNVVVTPATDVIMTFSNVTTEGTTIVTTSTTGNPPPSGFNLGNQPLYYEITTSAVFTGSIVVCFDYNESNYANENLLRLFHFTGSIWEDVTTTGYPDTLNNVICGTTSTLSPFIIAEATDPGPRLANISTRGPVQTGDSVMIGGFIISGSAPRSVLIRGFGPTLADWGVAGAMANPYIELYSGQTLIATNDDWQTPIVQCDAPAVSCGTPLDIQATGKDACTVATTGCSQDSAILVTLPPGAYTAIMRGVGGGTGVGLVGVDDNDTSTLSKLVNISTRGPVLTGDSVMIGGFIVSGVSSKTVLIRGFGPTLSDWGVTGAMANPYVELYSGQTMIATNDNWQTPIAQCDAPAVSCGTPQDIQATGKDACTVATTGCSQDAAILVTLPPGAYTAIVRGVSGGTGVGLVGIDEIGP